MASRWVLLPMGVAAFGLAILSAERLWTPAYDTDDPDFAGLGAQLREIEAHILNPRSGARIGLDLAGLRNGNWKTACLFGGYTRPGATLAGMGARLDAKDAKRLEASRTMGLRIAEVEEFEAMIAAIDEEGKAHLLHVDRGFGPAGQHFERCITKPDTMMVIDG